jgi:hypothetical protein
LGGSAQNFTEQGRLTDFYKITNLPMEKSKLTKTEKGERGKEQSQEETLPLPFVCRFKSEDIPVTGRAEL